jgi:DSF synthase
MDEIRLGDMEAAREDRLTPASPAAGGGIAKPVGLSDLDLEQDLQRLPDTDRTEGFALPSQSKLFDLGQIDVQWQPELNTLWAFITPLDRPNYNLGLLRDTMAWQMESKKVFASDPDALRYMVLGSRFPGVFNLGGDLEMFARCIENQDRETLRQYSHLCVDIVDRVWHCNDMPVINIGLAQGDALGGGFEALMCFDVIIAERQARFGLPEVLFGLFPRHGRLFHPCAEARPFGGREDDPFRKGL